MFMRELFEAKFTRVQILSQVNISVHTDIIARCIVLATVYANKSLVPAGT